MVIGYYFGKSTALETNTNEKQECTEDSTGRNEDSTGRNEDSTDGDEDNINK